MQQRLTASPPKPKETRFEQFASFVEFFVWLLVLKSFFLPLFIIPTGSMAETLYGAHATHVCPNCGREYEVGFQRAPDRPSADPAHVECPNCRWREDYSVAVCGNCHKEVAPQVEAEVREGRQVEHMCRWCGRRAAAILRRTPLASRLQPTSGDRIVVHGWPWVLHELFDGAVGPKSWDVVVFRNPNEPEVNYIKRLIGTPGQKIEIINGDVFINDAIARKPRHVQHELWVHYFDIDHQPRETSQSGYFPHWKAMEGGEAWSGLDTRQYEFNHIGSAGGIRFLTSRGPTPVCEINDIYGYNWPENRERLYSVNDVSDVRISCELELLEGEGFVELSATKHLDRFTARLHADGKLLLERESRASRERELLAETRVGAAVGRLALAVVDYGVEVELGRTPVLRFDVEITPGRARELHRTALEARQRGDGDWPQIMVRAENIRGRLSSLLIERDIYYTGPMRQHDSGRGPWHASAGQPIELGADEYFVLGDNSPESFDARFWTRPAPHLGPEYVPGTVPGDQLIGRAFLVYWPGFLPLWSGNVASGPGWTSGNNILPNFGRIRWIN